MKTAVNYLIDPITPYQAKIKAKEQKTREKRKIKWMKDLSQNEFFHLKSALAQAFITTQLQIECIDTIFEIQGVSKHFPLLKDFQDEMLVLESDLRAISILNEEDDANRLELEKAIEKMLKMIPKLNLQQVNVLNEFLTDLEVSSAGKGIKILTIKK